MSKDARKRAEQKGRRAETLCAIALRLKGYKILETRAKLPGGEIDLVAVSGDVIAFIEVKARQSEADALHAITPQSQKRILRASAQWMARHTQFADHGWRFDAMLVAPGRWPKHIIDAWRP